MVDAKTRLFSPKKDYELHVLTYKIIDILNKNVISQDFFSALSKTNDRGIAEKLLVRVTNIFLGSLN